MERAARSALSAERTGSRHRAVAHDSRSLDGQCACESEAAALLVATASRRFGQISPSIYETARLVAVAPWLPGHRARIDHLLVRQRRDGGWGGPDAYALVPTLSATEALLGTLLAPPPRSGPVLAAATSAVDTGLAFAHGLLGSLRAADLPDTPAIEVIVPSLVARLHAHLDVLRRGDTPGLPRWRGRIRLPLPRGLTDKALRAITSALARGEPA